MKASTAVTKIKSMVASLPTRAMKSMKEAMATSQETSWWRQRTYRREVCVDLKDVGKCGVVLSRLAKRRTTVPVSASSGKKVFL